MNEFAQFVWYQLQNSLALILLALPLIGICVAAVCFLCKRRNRQVRWQKALLWVLAVGYLLIVIYATLLRGMGGHRNYNLHLFRAWKEAWYNYSVKNWLNVLLNVALFVPMGFLLPLLFPKMQKWYATITAGFCFSLAIELFQLWRGTGICDVDDLFANTLGTVIGYGIIMLFLILLSGKENRWKCAMSYAAVVTVILSGILGIFIAYDFQEYGNIPESAAFRANTSDTKWILDCQLPEEKAKLPVYRAQMLTKEECDAFGTAFAEIFGIVFDDRMYYDKETYFMDHNPSDDGAHFLFVSYLDGSYRYTLSTVEEPQWVDGDREAVEKALEKYPLYIPETADFSVDGDGWHTFTAERIAVGDQIYDGVLRCRFSSDGKVYVINNGLISYEYYDEISVISPEKAVQDLYVGNFSNGDYFEYIGSKEVKVAAAAFEYRIDTKGFYRPIYVFTLVSTDGRYEATVMVKAN